MSNADASAFLDSLTPLRVLGYRQAAMRAMRGPELNFGLSRHESRTCKAGFRENCPFRVSSAPACTAVVPEVGMHRVRERLRLPRTRPARWLLQTAAAVYGITPRVWI